MIRDLSKRIFPAGLAGEELARTVRIKQTIFSPPASRRIANEKLSERFSIESNMTLSEHKEPRIVAQIPVQELWAGQRLVSTIRLRNLTVDDITSLLRAGEVRFAVADPGKELWWIPNNDRFDFWKNEVKPHLTTWEDRNELDSFPDSYFYIASEWQTYSGGTIILLEKHH